MQSNLQVPTLIATEVSAGTVNASAATFAAGVSVSGAVTAGTLTVLGTASVDTVFGQTANFTTVSAGTVAIASALSVTGTLTATTANGSGGTLTIPGTAVGYLVVSVSGVSRRVPFYAAV